jgi:hypothetical protein
VVKKLVITPNFLRSNSRLRWTERAIAAALLFLTGWAFIERDVAKKNEQQARAQTQLALANESRALTAISGVALERGRSNEAAQLALAAWPREDTRARSPIPDDPQQRDVINLFSNPRTRLLVTG